MLLDNYILNAVSIALTIALVLCIIRMMLGPTLADRVLALDLIGAILMSVFMFLGIRFDHSAYLSIALAIAVISFLATVSIATYLIGREDDL